MEGKYKVSKLYGCSFVREDRDAQWKGGDKTKTLGKQLVIYPSFLLSNHLVFFHSHELALSGLTVPNTFQQAEHNTWLGAELAAPSCHTIASTQKCRPIQGEKNPWRTDFVAVGSLWSWVFNSFGQVCVPSFGCEELMLVMLMNIGRESAAVKLVWCLLQLNIGELDKMSSTVPFLWFCELIWSYRTFASIKAVCWWLLERVNDTVYGFSLWWGTRKSCPFSGSASAQWVFLLCDWWCFSRLLVDPFFLDLPTACVSSSLPREPA